MKKLSINHEDENNKVSLIKLKPPSIIYFILNSKNFVILLILSNSYLFVCN